MVIARRRRLAALLAGAALLALGGGAAPAWGGDGAQGASGNGTTTVKYDVSYVDLNLFGPIECSGVHQVGKRFPGDAMSGGRDVFACESTSGEPLPGVAPDQELTLDDLGFWFSDYFSSAFGLSVAATRLDGLVSSDGFSFQAVAEYF
jgi:hypothetical protein